MKRGVFGRSWPPTVEYTARRFESSAYDQSGTQLTQTVIFVQEGTHIQEVPLIVKKVTDVKALFSNKSKMGAIEPLPPSKAKTASTAAGMAGTAGTALNHKENVSSLVSTMVKNEPAKHSISIETDEGTAILFCADMERLKNADMDQILNAINAGNASDGIYSLLENKMAEEMNCRIALQSLKKMIELENGWYRYRGTSWNGQQLPAETVNRDIVLQQLVNLIVKSRDNEMIIQGLKTLKRDRFNCSKYIYKDRMCNEAMIRTTDGHFTLPQLMRVVKILASYKDPKYRSCVDMLWVGLACRERDIKPNLLVPLFRSLKYFHRSRGMVQIILEKKLAEQWLQMTGSQMANILDCLYGKDAAKGCLSSTSKWANVSMTTSTEKDLVSLISSLHTKTYVDENIEQALARYVMAKSTDLRDSNLIATIMDYCRDLRVRNSYILAECGNFFAKHGMEIVPSLLSSIITPFGVLNVQPPNPNEFWKVFDEVISARFSDLKLNDALDILLSCTYLERYPIKFLDKIFSSYLLDRLQNNRDAPVINRLKTKLKLFDATMSLECKDYQGSPVNLGRSTKSLNLDMRIRGIVNKIHKPLAHLVGGEHKLSRSVILSKLPLINFYILDIMVHPLLKSTSVFNLNLHKKRNVNTAILVHLPEYYCWNTQLLTGPQVMRKRQIRKMGFRVACLDYAKLTELVNQDDKLLSYLSQRLDAAEDAL